MSKVVLENVTKSFDKKLILDDINLEIKDREFVVLLGASGCGKSTLLRMIAGLEKPTSGQIYIGSKCVNKVAPKDRDIAMVFQSYALYPHLSVYENIAFPLKIRKTAKCEIKRRVENAVEILGLEDYLERKPRELSGGQRQRVALGRAIVREPKVFLMDEPLSNLDAKLRVSMRAEIKKLHKKLNTTFIYVTHDQTEALTMGDKIVILDGGKIQQAGSSKEIFKHPANTFVASFIGSNPANLIPAVLDDGILSFGGIFVNLKGVFMDLPKGRKDVIAGIRPENIAEKTSIDYPFNLVKFSAQVNFEETLGSNKVVYFKLGDTDCVSLVCADVDTTGVADFSIDPSKIMLFDAETKKALF